MSHPIHRRLVTEELLRLRRSTEGRRYAAAQRSGRIDPNPHQVDAVIFALGRVREGGCILADEVGLGKTIEAGLVMAQLRAEGARRILLLTPKALLGQWREELFNLFGVSAIEVSGEVAWEDSGVFLLSREQLGSEAAWARLSAAGPFDLCVVDEAHEVFSSLYRRFDRDGRYLPDAPLAKLAGRLRTLLAGQTPALLLTATPLQNSLTELWGLVQYVDPSGTLLGDLSTFRQLFCADDDRRLQSGQEAELQRRLGVVVRRTLRRQAEEFLRTPFVGRRTRLFEYDMSPSERELYEDVTRYLLTPGLAAFSGRHRKLLLLGFHRRMASSHRALAASLEGVAERLRKALAGEVGDETGELARDLEDLEDLEEAKDEPEEEAPDLAAVRSELAVVEALIARVSALDTDSKARALLDAVRVLETEAARGQGSGKLVIFTESLRTQEYLRELLLERGVPDEQITLFRGQNSSPRAEQALRRWYAEVQQPLGSGHAPSREVALRLALVHEFRRHSRIFISTEAGAKGLNLQFCDTLINYDLPWNPQRIEQRIGRCHRYGQTRDVTVINFLARDNEAQRLTFEILSRKLELFGAVLDASDHVLYEPSGSAAGIFGQLSEDFASELLRIYDSARSERQLAAELSRLDGELGARSAELGAIQARTRGLIEARLDATVRQAFRQIAEELPGHLLDLDRDLEKLVCEHLDSEQVAYRRVQVDNGWVLEAPPDARLPDPLSQGFRVTVGGEAPEGVERLSLRHPLVRLAADAARRATAEVFRIRIGRTDPSPELELWRGRTGRLRVEKLLYPGFEPVERLLPVAVFARQGSPEGGPAGPNSASDGHAGPSRAVESAVLDRDATLGLLAGPLEPVAELESGVSDLELEEAMEEALFHDEREVSAAEHRLFARAIAQLERCMDDRVLLRRREREALLVRIHLGREQVLAAAGSDARSRAETALGRAQGELEAVDAELERLQSRQDDGYRRWRERAHERRYAPPVREVILEAEFIVG